MSEFVAHRLAMLAGFIILAFLWGNISERLGYRFPRAALMFIAAVVGVALIARASQ